MGTHYTSYCENCKLAIEDGKDWSGIRHELFKLFHNYRYKDHKIERYDDNQWIDKWLNDEKNEPEELYDEKLGYLITIPQWLEEIIEKETEYWIKNESGCKTEEDVIRQVIEMNQDKLMIECLNEFEYRLKRVLTINEQYDRLKDRQIELLPKQRLIILTYHGKFVIDDMMEYINLFAVRDGERIWIARLVDNKILKYGTENEPMSEYKEIYMETVNLEDVRVVLQTHEGETLYPIMINNIIREIRKRSLKQEKIDNSKNPFL